MSHGISQAIIKTSDLFIYTKLRCYGKEKYMINGKWKISKVLHFKTRV